MWLENPNTHVTWFVSDAERISELKQLGYTLSAKENGKTETPKTEKTKAAKKKN